MKELHCISFDPGLELSSSSISQFHYSFCNAFSQEMMILVFNLATGDAPTGFLFHWSVLKLMTY
jgi:hypothetical protein